MNQENRPKWGAENTVIALSIVLGELSIPFMPTIAAKQVVGDSQENNKWRGPNLPYIIALDIFRVVVLAAGIGTQNDWFIGSYFVSGFLETVVMNLAWIDPD